MSFVKFTPISGSNSEKHLCYLLEIDEANILLDCGWSDQFDISSLSLLKKYTSKIDAVLFSHGDMDHLGAYPYAFSHLGLTCPAYATIPVHNMGSLAVTEAYKAVTNVEEFDSFTQSDIDTAFEKITQLRYSQHVILSGKAQGIKITAHRAGHTIGGTIWKIVKDTDQILYAVDYNHKKERHLNGTVLHLGSDALSRPSILITDSYNTMVQQSSRKQRDSQLIDCIVNSLRNSNSTVLLPVESSTRILELSYMLEQYWAYEQLQYPLLWYTHTSEKCLNYAKSMLEWMGDAVSQTFSSKKDNPFDFRHFKAIQTPKDLSRYPEGGRVILTSMASLDSGYSQELLRELGEDPETLVVLTDRGPPDSLSRKIVSQCQSEVVNLDLSVDLLVKEKIPLDGEELEEYLEMEALKAKNEEPAAALDDDSDSDMDDGGPLPLQATSDLQQFDIYIKDAEKSTGFFKQSKSFKMFPVFERRFRVDEYGEVIDPNLYENAELSTAIAQQEALEQMAPTSQVPKEAVIPCKYFRTETTLNLKCKAVYIDFEGRVDGNSIRNILSQVAPRKLILVHGSEDATTSLAQYCKDNEQLTNEIFTPKVGECINVSSARNIYQLKLTDSLISGLNMSKLGDYELAYISGTIQFPQVEQPPVEEVGEESTIEDHSVQDVDMSSSSLDKLDKVAESADAKGDEGKETDQSKEQGGDIVMEEAKADDESQAVVPFLEQIPLTQRPSHKPVLVGRVRLSDFRKILESEGFQTQFYRGVLVVEKCVVVRRSDTNGDDHQKSKKSHLIVEGGVSDTYYKVRNLLYSQIALL